MDSKYTSFAWDKADLTQIDNYRNTLNNKLSAINLSNDLINCKDLNCNSLHHKSLSGMLYSNLIDCCLQSGSETFSQIGSKNKTVPGWSDEIKHVREQSLFWHCIWSEAGKPTRGTLYEIMKRARHKYHYAARRLRKNKLQL